MDSKPSWRSRLRSGLVINSAIVLFVAILIGIMWNAVFAVLQAERAHTIQVAIDRNDNLAIAFEQYTLRTLQDADTVTRNLVRESVGGQRRADLVQFMTDYSVASKVIIGVALADDVGKAMTTAYTGKFAKPLNVADREHFTVHIERDSGRLFVGKPVVGRISGQGLVPVTRRINKADGTFGGIAVALIEPARFTDVLQDAKLRPLDVISLVGVDGITRARLSGTVASWGEDIGKSRLLAEQALSPNGNFLGKGARDGVLRYFSYRTLPDYRVIATVGAAEADVMAEFHRMQSQHYWLAGLTSAFIAGFGILLMLALANQRRGTASVARSESRFRQMAESIDEVFFLRDADGKRMLYVSPAYEQVCGRTCESLYASPESWSAAIHPDDKAAANEMMKNGLLAERFDLEYRIVRPDGSIRWIESRGFPVRDDTGKMSRITGVAKDITERKEAEQRITHLNRVLAMLGGISALIVRVRDRDELFNGACKLAVEAGGFRMAWIGIVDPDSTSLLPIASAGTDEGLMAVLNGLLASTEHAPGTMAARAIRERTAIVADASQGDARMLFGRQYTESEVRSLAVLPLIVADEAVGVFALYSSEVQFFHEEEMKLLLQLAGDIAFAIDHLGKQEQLDYLAYYDELTGLANRRLFLERVAQYMRGAARGGRKLAVFLVDLERFKNINDSLGRTAGDALLRQVAEWLTRKAAGDANLLARVGADHFALVMPDVRQEGDLTRLVEKWSESFLNHPFHLNDAVFRVAFKVGVALFPDDGADAETLFRNAEAARKKAKASGERYVFFKQTMTAAVAGKLTLENQLRQALDNGEFVLHYQPKVSLADGKITGAEALIRWNDPRTGLVPPGRFIPILEETGLIYEVGRWALRQAIADYLRWRNAGLPAVRIAVNVSPLQLRNRNFIAEIERTIGIDPLAAAGLELEITESVIMEDVKGNIACLQAIRAMGIGIAIDDFGTGFSSLSYLAKLPVHTLKIDRSFVVEMTVGPEGLALVSTIIKLAHALKLKVVAEGVETEEQQRLLRLLGCDEMQGFLFSKPLPVEVFEARYLTQPAAMAT